MVWSRSACGWLCCFALLSAAGAKASDGLAELAGPDAPPEASTVAPAAPSPKPAVPASTTGPAYAIKLTRPVRVGDRYRFVADATVLLTMSANVSGSERTLKPSNVSIHFEAVEHVLAVNGRGEPSKATYTITKCTKREGRHEAVFLPPGRVLTVEAGKFKSRIQSDAAGLSIQDEINLRAIVSLPSLKDVSLDDAFGTPKPRRPGDSWPVNAEAMARLISRQGVAVKKQDVSGSVTLKEVRVLDGVPHLLVQGKAKVAHYTPETSDLPPGTKLVAGTDDIKFTKLIPAGETGHCVTDSYSEKAILKVRTADEEIQADVLVDVKVLQTVGIQRTAVGGGDVASGAE